MKRRKVLVILTLVLSIAAVTADGVALFMIAADLHGCMAVQGFDTSDDFNLLARHRDHFNLLTTDQQRAFADDQDREEKACAAYYKAIADTDGRGLEKAVKELHSAVTEADKTMRGFGL